MMSLLGGTLVVVDAAQLRDTCLSMPGAFEDFPFGPEASVFKVRAPGGAAKMFALSDLDSSSLSISLKCEPALAEQLRAAHPEITGAYHMNKTHWNGVDCTGNLPDGMLRDMIEDSYDLVVDSLPKKDRESLGWTRLARSGEAGSNA
ncbi:putative DNA-binding protein (MmcQ/YjbR family) [Arthrobacter pigmenti]|uniref:Putative DNA-binding protein (MmcQ/YjbR family) n=1 Tax=Arthrobacter pigmenti TaxID=271432 RepID=A0A846RPQ0_9MICC|nr:putative DNA-binding protein (MmcQ/YjbR family) [Arthrobacter pigmenti]